MGGIISKDSLEVALLDTELVNLHDGIDKKIIKECTTPINKIVSISYDNTFYGGLKVLNTEDSFKYVLGRSGFDVLHDHSSDFRSVGANYEGIQHRVYVFDEKKLLDSYLKK